jgi:hypothetical protein
LTIAFGYVVIDRYAATGRTGTAVIEAMEGSYQGIFSDFFHDEFGTLSSYVVNATASLVLYLTHSISALDQLLSELEYADLALGKHNLHMLFLFFERIGLPVAALDPTVSWSKAGMYVSALGDSYLDFGFAGTLAMTLVLGVATAWFWQFAVRVPSLITTMLGAYLLTAALFSPFYSLLPTANGFSTLAAIAVAGAFLARRKAPLPFKSAPLLTE